jgi:hypothetical protein
VSDDSGLQYLQRIWPELSAVKRGKLIDFATVLRADARAEKPFEMPTLTEEDRQRYDERLRDSIIAVRFPEFLDRRCITKKEARRFYAEDKDYPLHRNTITSWCKPGGRLVTAMVGNREMVDIYATNYRDVERARAKSSRDEQVRRQKQIHEQQRYRANAERYRAKYKLSAQQSMKPTRKLHWVRSLEFDAAIERERVAASQTHGQTA